MSRPVKYKFRLYIAGDALNSAQALSNLSILCQAHLAEQYQIEVVDVLKNPKRALVDGIFMTPTLIKFAPSPVRMIVGTLGQTNTVLQALGLGAVNP